MITSTSTKQTSTCNATSIADTRQPTEIRATATSRDKPHFAHDGIS